MLDNMVVYGFCVLYLAAVVFVSSAWYFVLGLSAS